MNNSNIFHPVTTHRMTAQLPVTEYIARFYCPDCFLNLCAECHNYGQRYTCPPFDYDVLERISHYSIATIIGVQIIPEEKDLPLSAAQEIMTPLIRSLSDELLCEEQRTGGLSFGFACGCMWCGHLPCARLSQEPCRHPDKMRPSLEAYGFNLTKTAEELLHTPLLWGTNNQLPAYLMLICGIFD